MVQGTRVAQRDPNVYPGWLRQRFVRACVQGGTAPAQCSCIFILLRARWSAQQFAGMLAAAGGREPRPVRWAAKQCANGA